VTSAVATLNGTVGSNGVETTVTFEYGLTAAYGETITATQSPLAADAVNAAVSADLIGLNSTLCSLPVKATNSAGTTNGLDVTFTTGACSAPFAPTACAATRFNGDLGCTANDVNITNITSLQPSHKLLRERHAGNPGSRHDGQFASPTAGTSAFSSPTTAIAVIAPANGGSSSCSVAVRNHSETGSYTFPDLDGVPQGTLDTCGDGNNSINGGTGSASAHDRRHHTLLCDFDSGGKLFVPFVVSWDNQKSPIGAYVHPINTGAQYDVKM